MDLKEKRERLETNIKIAVCTVIGFLFLMAFLAMMFSAPRPWDF